MPQTNYDQAVPAGRAGLPYDSPNRRVSALADETIGFGLAVMSKTDDRGVAKLPRATVVAILEDGGTWTAGNGIVTLNGVTVSVAYNTDKATTFADLATAIQALNFVVTAAFAANTLTITAEEDVPLSGVVMDVSGITGTMTITSTTYTTTDELRGVSVFDDSLPYGTARRGAIQDRVVMTLSGDALAANDTVDGFVFGVAIDQVTYATSEANTLQLVANSILEVPGVDTAVVNATARTITISARPGKELVVTLTVDDDALASVAPSFAGVYSQQAMPISETQAAYLPGEAVGIVRQGEIWARVEEAIALGDAVFVRVAASATNTDIGALRNDIDGGTCQAMTALAFVSASAADPDGNLIARVETNMP
jgi:hypothetical protein